GLTAVAAHVGEDFEQRSHADVVAVAGDPVADLAGAFDVLLERLNADEFSNLRVTEHRHGVPLLTGAARRFNHSLRLVDRAARRLAGAGNIHVVVPNQTSVACSNLPWPWADVFGSGTSCPHPAIPPVALASSDWANFSSDRRILLLHLVAARKQNP